MKKLCLVMFVAVWGTTVSAQNPQIEIDPDFEKDVQIFAEKAARNVLDQFEVNFDFGTRNEEAKYQETTKEIEIPLTNPGERGMLEVESRYGKVKVMAYEGATVKVKITKYDKKVSKDKSEGGLRLVSSGSFNFEASEYNNEVKVENNGYNDRLDFEIMVPKNFDVKADTYNSGDIMVEGVEGEINAESYNGPITINNVAGSASASTYNGAIKITFDKVAQDTPMAFSTYNGDVDITIPEGTSISPKMKTVREIYTDFESFTIRESMPTTSKSDKGRFNVKYESWVEGDINGGGAEVLMKTRNGNIYIRKK